MFIRMFCKVLEISKPCRVADAGRGAARVKDAPARARSATENIMTGASLEIRT